MSQYQVQTLPNGDVIPQRVDDTNPTLLYPVLWGDPDFQAWRTAQQSPPNLSTAQAAIQSAKQMSFAQFTTWYAGATQQQQVRLLYELLQRALKSEIV